MSQCECYHQCCCEQRVPAVAELVAAARAVLDAAQPFTSAWEFDYFDMSVDGEEMAARLRAAIDAVDP